MKDNLILNVDGAVGAAFVDFITWMGAFTLQKLRNIFKYIYRNYFI
jgi:hypothetical protein